MALRMEDIVVVMQLFTLCGMRKTESRLEILAGKRRVAVPIR